MLAAFIGGLILNIMPCVLPVLSLKLLGVIKHGGGDSSYVRKSFIASSLGIITSFIALAIIVVFLKSAGVSVGWGFHFQRPEFIIFLIILINLFAANQLGFFEIPLPQFLSRTALKSSSNDSTLIGNFLTGIFVTILATPCSAPYLGTAIGFALSRGTFEIITIFIVMGFGLAAPYLLFSLVPNLVTKLPKPGAWMLKVKHFMGYLLIITSIWLLWVLSNQTSLHSAIALLGITIIGIFIFKFIKSRFCPSCIITKTLLIFAIIYLSFIVPMSLVERHENAAIQEGIWVKFEHSEIEKLVADDKVVFVDVTADWCITCKFNKINVMNSNEITELLQSKNIIAMKADYTSPSKEIETFLNSYGRYAIPFNIVFGKGAPEGVILSEILTKSAVIKAIEQARGD